MWLSFLRKTPATKCDCFQNVLFFLIYTNSLVQNNTNHCFMLFLIRRRRSAEKEFDVFLSFTWPCTSSQSAPGTDGEGKRSPSIFASTRCCVNSNICTIAGGSRSNLLNCEEGSAADTPLEVLLPRVIEEEWGHRLCLLERDVLPGGGQTSEHPRVCSRSSTLIVPVLFQRMQMMWSSPSRGARC